jgi:high-affinity Fe2+/Pb2+ permease
MSVAVRAVRIGLASYFLVGGCVAVYVVAWLAYVGAVWWFYTGLPWLWAALCSIV